MDKEELNKLNELAIVGNVDAIDKLINYYLSINDTKKAKLEAERLRYISNAVAYRKLAYLQLSGLFGESEKSLAKTNYQKAFELGDDISGYNLALIYINEKEYNLALHYLINGVNKNYIPSIKLLASLYLKGEGVDKDLEIALSLLKKVLELGEDQIISSIGKIYYQLGNYDEAFKCFNIGVNHHNLDAIYHLGLCYAKGLGTNVDLSKARFYYEMGANLNEPNCLYNLSLYYRNGISVMQNIPLADKLYEQAIENGFKK